MDKALENMPNFCPLKGEPSCIYRDAILSSSHFECQGAGLSAGEGRWEGGVNV